MIPSFRQPFRWVFLLAFMGIAMTLQAQPSDFVPKSRRTIEKERQELEAQRKRIVSSGIQSVYQTRFLYKFGKVNTAGITESLTRYDGKGNVVRLTTYNIADGSVDVVTNFRYDRNGNLVEELEKKNENTFKTVHRFNARNDRIETVIYKSEGAVDRKITYIYDETGLLLETVGRLDDGRIYMRDSYLYDGNGNVSEFRNNQRKFMMSYDRAGNLIEVRKYQRFFKSYDTIQFALNEQFQFDYDRAGHLVETRTYRSDSTLKSRTQYLVNERGNILAEKEFGSDGRTTYSKTLKYDKSGLLIEETGNDRALKFKEVYRYDQRGNRTEWTTYDQINEPVTVVRYTFGRVGNGSPQSLPGLLGDDDTVYADENGPVGTEELFQLLNARIIAPDGTYLGMIVADTANPQSIINSWGQYGFAQSPSSMFNPSIPYGGEQGVFSPFNPKCPSPPSIFKDGKFFSYLTENDNYRPRTSLRKLVDFLKNLSRQN